MTDFTQEKEFRNSLDKQSDYCKQIASTVKDTYNMIQEALGSPLRITLNKNVERVSNCCGADVEYDSDICSDCHEHCSIQETCDMCYGEGKVDTFDDSKSVEMRIDVPIKTIVCPKCDGEGYIEVDE